MTKLSKRLLGLGDTSGGTPAATDDWPDSSALGLRDAGLSGWFQNETDELFVGIPISPDDVVVDVGCGEGGNLNFCANRSARVIGIDMDPQCLEAARKKLATTPATDQEFLLAPAEELPLDDEVATRVICTEVLEHVDDPAVVLRELYRVAKPGALVLLTVPDALQERMQEVVAPDSYFQKPNHIRIVERDEFPELVRAAGLEVLDQRSYGFFWSIWWSLFWAAEVDLENPQHPVLDHWTRSWAALLETERGRELKQHLDTFLPKSQVIVARKPA